MDYWIELERVAAATTGEIEALAAIEGVSHGLWLFNPEELGQVRDLSDRGLTVIPIVPNLAAYVRDSTGGGPIAAMLRRFRRLGLASQAGLMLANAGNAQGILGQDFGVGLSILTEIELRQLAPLRVESVALASSVVDLAIALNNRQVIVRLLNLVEHRFGLRPILETANLGVTARKLFEWRVRTDRLRFLAPANPIGHGMRPDQKLCELVIRSGRVEVVTRDIDASGQVPGREALDYQRQLGVGACLVNRRLIEATVA